MLNDRWLLAAESIKKKKQQEGRNPTEWYSYPTIGFRYCIEDDPVNSQILMYMIDLTTD